MVDAWCPFAVRQPLGAKLNGRKALTPTASSAHTADVDAHGLAVGDYFARPEIEADSHFFVDDDGELRQYVPVNLQAWAQARGNDHVVSYETFDGGDPATPWTEAQVQTIGRLLVWLRDEWGISTELADKASGPGASYHSAWASWNPNGHACPGPVRQDQLFDLLVELNPKEAPVMPPKTAPVVTLKRTEGGAGYWLFTADGGVYTFGDAPFFGAAAGFELASPIVDAEVTPSRQGYWLVAADGGVFAYGDARFHGSLPELRAAGKA